MKKFNPEAYLARLATKSDYNAAQSWRGIAKVKRDAVRAIAPPELIQKLEAFDVAEAASHVVESLEERQARRAELRKARQERYEFECWARGEQKRAQSQVRKANAGFPTEGKFRLGHYLPPTVGITTLKARGWTEKLVAELLGEPFKMGANPHWLSGPKRRLWLVTTVLDAECDPRIRARQQAIKAR